MEGTQKQIRLLIVDDEQGFATVLAKRMQRRGLNVEIAFHGKDAVCMLRESDFDIAILDLKLEGMDGLEILKIFKLLAPDLPVIMLTGHGCERAAAECMKNGAAEYLSKPIDFGALMDKVLQVLKQEGTSP
ncbi:MAG: response regulator [Desulfovibrio sp.]